ncbi:MAG: hypothetical protein Q4E12_01365 [Coriobacteriia bacterium]|nr:hypothetical protein [Coriobacteriia bacterium]
MKHTYAFALLCCIGLLSVGVTTAAATANVRLSSSVELDTIDISITQEQSEDAAFIYDDDTITHVNNLENLGSPCWIRVAHIMTWENPEGTPQQALIPEAGNDQQDWIPGADGWYYLNRVLQEEESVPFVETLLNPEGMAWGGQLIQVESSIEVQAVQAQNFTPDFQAEQPWGTIAPQACIYSREPKEVPHD